MDALQNASVEDFDAIDEIGDIIAQSVYDFLHSDYGQQVIGDLESLEITMEAEKSTSRSSPCGNLAKAFVVAVADSAGRSA